MKRSTLDVLLLVNKTMDKNRDIPFSIDWLAALTKITWRTAKSCLEALVELGLIEKIQLSGNTRYHYLKRDGEKDD